MKPGSRVPSVRALQASSSAPLVRAPARSSQSYWAVRRPSGERPAPLRSAVSPLPTAIAPCRHSWPQYHAWPDWALLSAVRGVRDARVAALLIEALESELSVGDRRLSSVLTLLASEGESSAAALPRIAELADSHWSGLVRREAADAYTKISGVAKEPGPYRCPSLVRRLTDAASSRWFVQLGAGVEEELAGPAPLMPLPRRAAGDASRNPSGGRRGVTGRASAGCEPVRRRWPCTAFARGSC